MHCIKINDNLQQNSHKSRQYARLEMRKPSHGWSYARIHHYPANNDNHVHRIVFRSTHPHHCSPFGYLLVVQVRMILAVKKMFYLLLWNDLSINLSNIIYYLTIYLLSSIQYWTMYTYSRAERSAVESIRWT